MSFGSRTARAWSATWSFRARSQRAVGVGCGSAGTGTGATHCGRVIDGFGVDFAAGFTGGGFEFVLGRTTAGLGFPSQRFAIIEPGGVDLLAGGQTTEVVQLIHGQVAPLANFQALDVQGANSHAVQPHDFMAKLGPHPAHFAVLAFGQHHFHLGGVSGVPHHANAAGAGFAVGQPNPFHELGDHVGRGVTGHHGLVHLLYAELGVGQLVGQLAVVGQNQQAGAVFV